MFILSYLYNNFNKKIIQNILIKNSSYFFIKLSFFYFLFFVKFLKLNQILQFTVLSDIVVVDTLSKNKRYNFFYYFLSKWNNTQLFLNFNLKENILVPSLSTIFFSANWIEREIFDMFGIFFSFHQDLRRILTDYGFEGNPLKKEFPLSGFFEVFYDDSLKKIVYDKIELVQEYRIFDFKSPWESFK